MAKSYRQTSCPLARALDVIGERWSILMLRDLLLHGPRRLHAFQDSLAGVASNMLSAQVKTLETQGVIERRCYSEHPPRLEYRLTNKEKDLGPALKALKKWGDRYR